ncbi:MAG: class I SAM-dependent methyltransferase [Pseudomonadota bacterium]
MNLTSPAPAQHRAPPPNIPPGGIDYAAIKHRQQATWASGDYAVLGTTLQIVGERLAEAADVRADERVLDVAAGNGNASLAAAHRNARVVSTDYVPQLLEKGAARARAEALDIAFQTADAELLPFADASFDVALSSFGVMFTPNHQQAARELIRVVRPGGRIGLANWTPDGFIGQLFRLIGGYIAPPPGVQSPALWGSEPHLVELFGPSAAHMASQHICFTFRYRSPEHWLEVFRTYYGPLHKTFAALAPEDRARLEADILALLERHNSGGAHSLVVPSDYLEVVIVRQ